MHILINMQYLFGYNISEAIFTQIFSEVTIWGVARILDSYANPRLRLGFAQPSRILPTPLVFISGYANTGNVFYCLNLNNRVQRRNCLKCNNEIGSQL